MAAPGPICASVAPAMGADGAQFACECEPGESQRAGASRTGRVGVSSNRQGRLRREETLQAATADRKPAKIGAGRGGEGVQSKNPVRLRRPGFSPRNLMA